MATPAAVLRISGDPIVRVDQPAHFEVAVHNISSIVESFSLEVLGSLAPAASFDRHTLNLLPGQEQTAVVAVVVPPDHPAGSTVLAIKVVPAWDPTGTVVEEVEVCVEAITSLSLRVVPAVLLGRRATAEVEITNAGNSPVDVSLGVDDPSGLISARFGRDAGVVPPGGMVRTPLRLRLDRRYRQAAPFAVEVVAGGRTAARADAQLGVGRRRRILVPVLALAVVLMAAMLAVPLLRSDALPIFGSGAQEEASARQDPTPTSPGLVSDQSTTLPPDAGAPTTLVEGAQPAGTPAGGQPTPGGGSTVTTAGSGTGAGAGAGAGGGTPSAGPLPTVQPGPASRAALPPTTMSLTPIADAYSNEGDKNANYGGSSSLASRGTYGYVSYLRFAFPAAPAGQRLTKAVLRIQTNSSDFAGSPQPHTVSLASNSWSEDLLNWNNQPGVTGPTVGSVQAPSFNTPYEALLNASQLEGKVGDNTLAITQSREMTDNIWFWSRNHAAPHVRPQLTLTFS